jgi:hypothetical protein
MRKGRALPRIPCQAHKSTTLKLPQPEGASLALAAAQRAEACPFALHPNLSTSPCLLTTLFQRACFSASKLLPNLNGTISEFAAFVLFGASRRVERSLSVILGIKSLLSRLALKHVIIGHWALEVCPLCGDSLSDAVVFVQT